VTEICLSYFGEKEEKGVQEVTEAECLKKDVISQSVKRSERQIELEKVADVGPGVKKIVLFAPEAVLGSVEKKDGANTVSGEVRANILYLNEGDEVVEISAVMPFSESFEQKDASYDLTIRNARIVLTDDEGGNVIEAEASLVIEEIEYEEKRGSAVVAVCGERQETEEVAAKAVCERYLGQRVFEEDLSGTIPLDVPDAYVAFVRPGCHALAEVRAEEGVLQVEGVSAFRVIYLTQEGYDAVQGEFPFRFALPFPEAKVGQRAEVSVKITDPKAVPSGKEVAVTAKISFDAVLSEEEGTTYLSEVREGTIRPESEAGISVYFAEKGEDLWQIAKTMGVLPSALVKANPFLADPMDEARKVLIFRSK